MRMRFNISEQTSQYILLYHIVAYNFVKMWNTSALGISATQAVKWVQLAIEMIIQTHPNIIYSAWASPVVSTSFSFSKTSWWFPILTAILQMDFSLNHQLIRNQGPILWAYWHQSFPRQVGGVWLRSMKNLKGSQPQRWIESSLGMLKNSHLFWPELSGWWRILFMGILRLKIMENSNHFVPRAKLFIFEIASLTNDLHIWCLLHVKQYRSLRNTLRRR